MKLQLPILLLAAVVESSPQLLGSGPTLPLAGKTVGKAKIRPTAKRETLRYGPVDLYAKTARKPVQGLPAMDPTGQAGMASISAGLCKSCTVLSASFFLTYEDGTPATVPNGLYIHHFISYDTTKSLKRVIPGCEGGLPSTYAPFIDRGEDSGETETVFTTPDGKFNSGFQFGKAPKLLMQYDLVNLKDKARKIYINLEVEYVEGLVGKDASHSLKTVTCVPGINPRVNTAGPTITTSSKMTVSSNSTIVWGRGHLHSGGVDVKLMVNGKVACTSKPTYNEKNVITTMSICPEPINLKTGDAVTISSNYDLSKHKLRESNDGKGTGAKSTFGGADIMGMMAISYAY
jgi:hypothetical protein